MLIKSVLFVFWLLTALTLFTTLAPLSNSQMWWVRGWDFPRIHIAIVAVATIVIGVFVFSNQIAVAMVLLASCAIYQSYRIFPYTPLAAQEVSLKTDAPDEARVSFISSNVLKENSNHAGVIDLIETEQPDVLFLMEIDQIWSDALAPTLSKYKTVINLPKDDHYGLIFATNLPVLDPQVRYLSDDDTPSVLADLEGPSGRFFFVGLHPRPPVPGHDTEERDAQIKRAALLSDRKDQPVVAMGDFNDVAWSATSQQFKEIGEFLDPRVGRGILPSFDAQSIWMRFPIDQLYITKGLDLVSFSRLRNIGSDHFPMKAVLTVAPKGE